MNAVWSAITAIPDVIGHARFGFVAAAFAIDTAALVLMAFRWRLLLRGLNSHATLWEALLAYSAGVCVGNVTPARAVGGDACRVALIRRPGGSPPLSAIVASVVCDRLTDAAGILVIGLLALPLAPKSAHWLLLPFAVLAIAFVARPAVRRLTARLVQRHPVLRGDGLGRAVTAAIGSSLVIWVLDITRVMLIGAAFDVRLSPFQAAAVSLLRLGSGAIPIPGGIGVVDGALIGGFLWLGLPHSTAVAMAIVERAIVYGWQTALGGVSLLLLGGSRAWKKARDGSVDVESAAAPVPD